MIIKYGKGFLDKGYNIFSLKHRLHIVAKIACLSKYQKCRINCKNRIACNICISFYYEIINSNSEYSCLLFNPYLIIENWLSVSLSISCQLDRGQIYTFKDDFVTRLPWKMRLLSNVQYAKEKEWI